MFLITKYYLTSTIDLFKAQIKTIIKQYFNLCNNIIVEKREKSKYAKIDSCS